MNRIIASAGLMAVGAAGLQAANVGDLRPTETSKPWTVSASLRAFYDDNYNTAPSALARDSFGFEFRPGASIYYLPTEQTYIGAAYVYSLKWFEDRQNHNFDQSHELTLKADHRFSERFRVNFNDAFAYSQEPEVINGAGLNASLIRQNSDVLRNRAAIKLNSQLTERLELETGYENVYWDYKDPLYSTALDRVEHTVWIDPRLHIAPDTVILAGYQFKYRDYLDVATSVNDSAGHYAYLGIEKSLTSQLNVAAKAGVELTHYMHQDIDDVGPYADVSATYTYLPGSYLQLGVRHDVIATDVTIFGSRSQDATGVYGQLNHRITPNLTGSLLGQFQHGTFNGGIYDGQTENQILFGLNFEYRITQNIAAELGYNFDRLDSDLGRSYSRNRVYTGVRASF
ncbi:MAG: hypothetical protein JWM16_3656 [Verrucomicrobiales bacterium]|nr:hypothetical protein [Verrucomicrobiales bacterium]